MEIAHHRSDSWQPREYFFLYTLVEIGPFLPSLYFPHHKNKKSPFVRFTLSLVL